MAYMCSGVLHHICCGHHFSIEKKYNGKYNGNLLPNHAHHLNELVASMFGPSPAHPVRTLELRIYYPGADSYSAVWGDDNSPTVVVLRNIFSGEIDIEVWRGRHGTWVFLTVRPTERDE